MRRLALELVCVGLLAACGGVEAPTEEPKRDQYIVTLRVHADPAIFEPSVVGHVKPYDEGYLLPFDPDTSVPATWQSTTEAAGSRTGGIGSSGSAITYPPMILHPDIVTETTLKLRLPGYICAHLYTITDHTLVLEEPTNWPLALSSRCQPYPENMRDLSLEEAQATLPPANSIIDAPIDVTVDTLVARVVFDVKTNFSRDLWGDVRDD